MGMGSGLGVRNRVEAEAGVCHFSPIPRSNEVGIYGEVNNFVFHPVCVRSTLREEEGS